MCAKLQTHLTTQLNVFLFPKQQQNCPLKQTSATFFSVLSRYKKYKIVSFFLRSTSFQKLFYKYYFFYKKGAFRRKKSKVTKTTREERKWRLSHFKYFEKVFLCFFVIFGRIHKRRKR
jgi:hypothetical protein